MRRRICACLAVLVIVPALCGLDEKKDKDKPEKPKTPREQYDALVTEHQKAFAAYIKAVREAKTNEERQKAFREKYPQPDKYAGKMMEIAGKYPNDPVAIDAAVWVVQQAARSANADKAYAFLTAHADSQKLASACQMAAFSTTPAAGKFLRTVMEKNPDKTVQASAAFGLTQYLLNSAQRQAHDPKEQEKLIQEADKIFEEALAKHGDSQQLLTLAQQLGNSSSPAASKMLRMILEKSKSKDARGNACFALAESLRQQSEQANAKKSEQLSKEAEALYERVIKEFADAKRFNTALGAAAKGALNEIRLLGIGKVAPEIAGQDIDGKPFKLSDYRGKVVMLDFWGNW
jgi:translation initiation factor 2B subunit (eIF-2B alpha/beta/delta family)